MRKDECFEPKVEAPLFERFSEVVESLWEDLLSFGGNYIPLSIGVKLFSSIYDFSICGICSVRRAEKKGIG
jgi:hypothetical protein